jgi:hypothetical protein
LCKRFWGAAVTGQNEGLDNDLLGMMVALSNSVITFALFPNPTQQLCLRSWPSLHFLSHDDLPVQMINIVSIPKVADFCAGQVTAAAQRVRMKPLKTAVNVEESF